MSGNRNQSVKNSAKSVIINMNPKVVLERISGPEVESLQRTSEDEGKSDKLEILEYEENTVFECPFCDCEAYSRMELLGEHATSFHKISKAQKKSTDIVMIFRLLNISVTSLESVNLDQTSFLSAAEPLIALEGRPSPEATLKGETIFEDFLLQDEDHHLEPAHDDLSEYWPETDDPPNLNDDQDFEEELKPKSKEVLVKKEIGKLKRKLSQDVTGKGNKIFKCGICDSGFVNAQKLRKHQRETHTVCPVLQCDLCPKNFENVITLKKHKLRVHVKSSEEKNHICKICGKAFDFKSTLKAHEKSVHSEPVVCEICGSTRKSQTTLLGHMRRAHPPPEVAFKCGVCNKILKNRRSLGVHMATHNDPTVVCEQCGKLFKSKRRLRQHKKIMHKDGKSNCLLDKPVEYNCTSCKIKFENSSQLLTHNQKDHTKMRGKFDPVTCHLCGKVFSNKSTWGTHVKHTHEKRYLCECKICGKTVLSKRDLDLHILRKHKNDPQCAELKARMEENKKLKLNLTASGASNSKSSKLRMKKTKLKNHDHVEDDNPDGPEFDENK